MVLAWVQWHLSEWERRSRLMREIMPDLPMLVGDIRTIMTLVHQYGVSGRKGILRSLDELVTDPYLLCIYQRKQYDGAVARIKRFIDEKYAMEPDLGAQVTTYLEELCSRTRLPRAMR